ncbi:hypothetical protein AB0O00_40065, partial [Kitasatospora sp. NPDC093558]
TDPLAGPPPLLRGSAIRFADAPCGELLAVTGQDQVTADPDVAELRILHEVGQHLGPVRWSGDRAGYVIATGDTAAEAKAKAAASVARLVFSVAPGPATGPSQERPGERDLSRENDLSRHLGYDRTDGPAHD